MTGQERQETWNFVSFLQNWAFGQALAEIKTPKSQGRAALEDIYIYIVGDIYRYIVGDIYRYIVRNIYRCIEGDIYRYIVGDIYRYILGDIFRYMVGYLHIYNKGYSYILSPIVSEMVNSAECHYRDKRLFLYSSIGLW